jgi:hypothetical protein
VRVVASGAAVELVREQGGCLYVWLKRGRCCGAVTTLSAATKPPGGNEFRRVDNGEDFELYLPSALTRVPDELHVRVRRLPRRVAAYWNGCAWVI